MAVVRILAALARDTLIAEDQVQNTWHFTTQSDDVAGRAAETAALLIDLKAFYSGVGIDFAASMAGTVSYRAYDLSEPETRVPFLVDTSTFSPAAVSYPSEVAICMSFQGVAESGVPQARRRGRVFLGAYGSGAGQLVTGGVRPSAAVMGNIDSNGQLLLDASEAAATWSWIVFSPTSAGPENPDGTFPNLTAGIVVVDNGWVDNAFDTIRSRGLRATSRLTFT